MATIAGIAALHTSWMVMSSVAVDSEPSFSITVFSTSASWQTNTKRLKLLTIPVCVCWFVYNLFSRSYAGMANETFVLGSVIVALYRLRGEGQTAAGPATGGEA